MTWREVGADQNLRLAALLLERQGELNEARKDLAEARKKIKELERFRDELLDANEGLGGLVARQKRALERIATILDSHDWCGEGCTVREEIREVLDDLE